MNVPKFQELAVPTIYSKAIRKYPDLKDFFPDNGESYVPPRSYFWNVFATVMPEKVG